MVIGRQRFARCQGIIGEELVLCVDGELRRTRLYRAHEQAALGFVSGRVQ
jgi:hypothetical protein